MSYRPLAKTLESALLTPASSPDQVLDGEDDKYLIATSEQPLSGMYMDEWFEDPKNDLPIKCVPTTTLMKWSQADSFVLGLQDGRLFDVFPKGGWFARSRRLGYLPSPPIRED